MNLFSFFKQGAVLFPIACWGLIEYMLFLYLEFGDPLAFAKTQQHWWQRTPESLSQYLGALATLEPIWSVYDPDSVAYWGRGMIKNPVFSLHFANPIYFVLTVGLVAYGGWKRWLDTKELLLSAGLLLIPYTMHSYQNCFLSQGRYSSIVFPAYLVMGRILVGCHWIVRVLFFGCCAFWLGAYSAYFAAWYDII